MGEPEPSPMFDQDEENDENMTESASTPRGVEWSPEPIEIEINFVFTSRIFGSKPVGSTTCAKMTRRWKLPCTHRCRSASFSCHGSAWKRKGSNAEGGVRRHLESTHPSTCDVHQMVTHTIEKCTVKAAISRSTRDPQFSKDNLCRVPQQCTLKWCCNCSLLDLHGLIQLIQ